MALSKKAKEKADTLARGLDAFLAEQGPRLRKAEKAAIEAAESALASLATK